MARGTTDDLPIDGMNLDEIERLKQEFHLDEARARLILAVTQGIPITGIGNRLTEDYWLAEVMKDIEGGTPSSRSRAMTMMGMYLGILSDKASKRGKMKVKFQEDPEEAV